MVDSSSRNEIGNAKVSGVVVDSSKSNEIVNSSNTTELIDVSNIEGEKFSGTTDSTGQFTDTVKIKKSLNPGVFGIVVTVDADGYKPMSKVGTFEVK